MFSKRNNKKSRVYGERAHSVIHSTLKLLGNEIYQKLYKEKILWPITSNGFTPRERYSNLLLFHEYFLNYSAGNLFRRFIDEESLPVEHFRELSEKYREAGPCPKKRTLPQENRDEIDFHSTIYVHNLQPIILSPSKFEKLEKTVSKIKGMKVEHCNEEFEREFPTAQDIKVEADKRGLEYSVKKH
ncbi:hypothetical protein ACFLZZ_00090 [Nanoarchaeota archaeon]